MKESRLCSIIKKNITEQKGWCYKIPDPSGMEVYKSSERPFDLFGYTNDFNFDFEVKLIKNDFRSFNIKQIREHQISHLKCIKEICKNQNPPMLTCIVLGVYIPRKYIELFWFDIDCILLTRSKGKKSFLRKELLLLKEQDRSICMRKETFDITTIPKKIINKL